MIRSFLRKIYYLFRPVRISGYGNRFTNESKIGTKFRVIICGRNNNVFFGKNCLLTNTTINVSGDNNKLIVEDNVRFIGPCCIFMKGGGTLHIKYNAGIRGVEFNLNGNRIEVGEMCMFSYGITIRNHDSHRILDPETKHVLNPSKDIIIGNHVWIGQNATILKGCHIADDSVIGFGSIVTKSCNPGSVMTGIPAKVVHEGITWDY